jgi:N-acetylglutamate synthase-like GNAT family acetyltransferase
MQIEIGPAKKEDIPKIIKILKIYNMGEFGHDERPSLPPAENFFVAKKGKEVIGCSAFLLHNTSKLAKNNTEAETASLAVIPRYLGKGIGNKLQIARLQRMYELGIKKVYTEVDTPSIIEWYINKFGYKKILTRKKFNSNYGDPNIDTYTLIELNLEKWHEGKK